MLVCLLPESKDSQTNHRSDFWKVGFVVNHEPADLFDVLINSFLSLAG